MITVIHGDDIVSSRKYFIEKKQKVDNAQILSGVNVTLTELIQLVEGSLFVQTRHLFIENLFISKKKEELKHVLPFLLDAKNVDVLLWEGKELSAGTLSSLPKAKALAFNLPKTLFSFLDSIKSGNGRSLVLLFHKVLKEAEAELVFYMLVRQFRMLLALSELGTGSQPHSDPGSQNQIDEVSRIAPWQKEKLARQAKMFSLAQLKTVYSKLYEIDLAQKTGQTSLSLSQNIDIFLLDL